MRAKITLLHCETFTGRNNVKVRKGDTFVSTNAAEIRYYQSVPEFSVEVIEEKPTPKAAKPKAAAPAPQPVVEDDDDDEGDEGDDDEGEGSDDDLDDLDDEGDDEGEGEEQEDEPVSFTKTDLKAQKKSELIEIAKSHFDLELNPDLKKDTMVARIMKAQITALNAD